MAWAEGEVELGTGPRPTLWGTLGLEWPFRVGQWLVLHVPHQSVLGCGDPRKKQGLGRSSSLQPSQSLEGLNAVAVGPQHAAPGPPALP